jgi:hypothetical protein
MTALPQPVASPFALAHLTSRQGLRSARNYIHNGIDLVRLDERGNPMAGDLFYPMAPGIVEEVCRTGSRRCSGYGNGILVRHGDDLLTWYAHADDVYVEPGDVVWPLAADPEGLRFPTPLGTIGTTFGTPDDPDRRLGVPHVHLEITHAGWPFAARDVASRYDVMGVLAASGVGLRDGALTAGLAPFEYSEDSYQAALDSVAKGERTPVRVAPPETERPRGYGLLICAGLFGLAAVVVVWPRRKR